MKKLMLLTASALIIAGCNTKESPEAAFEADCLIITNNPDAKRPLEKAGMVPEEFCSCALAEFKSGGESDKAELLHGMDVMSSRLEDGAKLRDVFREIEEAASDNPDDEAAKTDLAGAEMLGDFLDDITDAIEENEGVCPAG